MADDTQIEQPVDWTAVGEQLAAGLLKVWSTSGIQKAIVSAQTESHGAIAGTAMVLSEELLITAGTWLDKVLDAGLPLVAAVIGPSIVSMFGSDLNKEEFVRRLAKGGDVGAGEAVAEAFMKALAAAGQTQLQPSREPATKFAGAAVSAALGGTLNALIPEILGQVIPLDWLHFHDLAELPDEVIRVLGVGRLVQRAVRPLVDATCATPMRWDVNRTYRPELLSAALAAKQIVRGFGSKDQWLEELRRLGYSEDRISVLLNEQRHFFSPGDVRTFVARGHWDRDRGLKHLRDQGYEEDAATDAIRLEGLRRIDQLEDQEAAAITSAYVAGDIDRGTFLSMLGAAVTVETERALLEELADVRRAANVKQLTLGQIEAMVKSGVLNVIDYRRAAERQGYAPGDVTALELQLRWELDKDKKIEQHRAELEAQRAAEKQAKADAAAAKKATLEQQRALERRGKRADLERAAVRGLITLDRVAEVYRATFDEETAGILLQLLEDERQAYLDQQSKRDEAAKRGAVRGVDVGALEAAVTQGVLTLDEFRTRLRQLGFDDGDAGLLAATLQAKLDDVAAAKEARDAAAAAAKVKHVSLTTIEMLVRRGHRTMADYDRTLQDLGFDEGARAAMLDLLQDQIDEDAKARAEREAASGKVDPRGLSLEQMRRGVLVGVQTVDQFQAYLVQQQFTADAQQVLVAELRADVAEAEAARQRRADADAARDTRDAPLADVARAARLGLIPVQVYADRLTRAGYGPDAVDLEIDLLVEEMTDIAEARAQRAAAEEATRNKPLPLADVGRSVKAGRQSLGSYRQAARDAGYSAAAADAMARLLQDEIDAAAAAKRRRDEIAAAAAQRSLSLSQLEAAVRAGVRTIEQYRADVLSLGYSEEDAAIVVALLVRQLAVLDTAAARRAAIDAAQPEQRASLAQIEQGVKGALITMAGYIDELRRRGFGDGVGIVFDEDGRLVLDEGFDGPFDDTALLALLLQQQLDAAAAKGA